MNPLIKPFAFKYQFQEFVLIPICLGSLLLVGYFGLLLGDTFFVDSDVVLNFDHNKNNVLSKGWRPDVALGSTYFFGDIGLYHVWSLSRFWAEMFEDDRLGFQVQVFVFIWFACFVQYLFLRKLIPGMSRMMAFFLSSLIAFSSLRYEFLFFRSNTMQIPATCLLSLVLWDFLKQPKIRHYFYYTAIMWTLAFWGSSGSVFQVLVFVGIFCIGVAVYNRWHFFGKELWVALRRFFILNIATGFSMVILGAWIFYALIWEQVMVGYVRDPDYSTDYFVFWPGMVRALTHTFNYFNAGLFSVSSSQLGLEQNISIHSWTNFSPIFPFIFLVFVFLKSKSFWEYISKFVIITSFFFHEILYWFPGFFTLTQKLIVFYPLGKLHPCIQVFEILMTGFLLVHARDQAATWCGWSVNLARVIAGLLVPLYLGLCVVIFLTSMMPEWTANMASIAVGLISPAIGSEAARSFLPMLAVQNVRLFHETMGWSSILFYGTTALFLTVLAGGHWRRLLTWKGGLIFAVVLFGNNLLLSWAVYPLEKKPLVWDTLEISGKPAAETFGPTDRWVRVGLPPCSGRADYYDCIRHKFFDEEFGPRRNIIGYRLKQALDFGKVRSFTPKPTADFINSFMRLEGHYEPGILRTLQMEPPIFASRIYDISAVNYLLSQNRLPDAENLELVHKNKQFYLYRNHRAWPYFYFADRFETIDAYEDLYDAEQGVAYLWEGDARISLSPKLPDGDRKVEMVKFEYGDVEFKYSSDVQEFLVMADSWHPNWRANVNGKDIPIVKTNGVFKGVLLPPGAGTVHFYFDNTSYLPGIWISIVSWVLFFFGWSWCVLRLREKY
jgi:hypothetical protein